MKENVLDVLMYLFENYIYEEPELTPDRNHLHANLQEAGFSPPEVEKAFEWLDGLAAQREGLELSGRRPGAVRQYSDAEEQKLDCECRGFLLYLENCGVLDSTRREQVVDRVMALESQDVDLEDLKWIILIVLFKNPGQEAAYAWMENLMFDSFLDYAH